MNETILTAAVAALSAIGSWGIYRMVQHGRRLADNSESIADSAYWASVNMDVDDPEGSEDELEVEQLGEGQLSVDEQETWDAIVEALEKKPRLAGRLLRLLQRRGSDVA